MFNQDAYYSTAKYNFQFHEIFSKISSEIWNTSFGLSSRTKIFPKKNQPYLILKVTE